MAIGAAAGYPQHSGVLIPEVWSKLALKKFYAATFMSMVTNTDYEGEIKGVGDKVIIRQVPDITIKPYVKGQTLVPEYPQAPNKFLYIDRSCYWFAGIDKVDEHQSDMDWMAEWGKDAIEQARIYWERLFLADIYADAATKNKGATAGAESSSINLGVTGTPLAITSSNAVDLIVNVGTVFDEQNVPAADRAIIVPNWLAGALKLSDLKAAYLTGDDTSPLRNGRVGRVNDMDVYQSNLLSSVTDGGNKCWNVVALQKSGASFASQIVDSKIVEPEEVIGRFHRGLQVCGWEGLKPEAIVHAYVRKG
jgi:hypothetical protein